MHDVLVVFVAVLVTFVPGAALLLALGVRRPLWFAATAPAASIGVAALLGVLCGLVGLPFGPIPLGVVTLALLVVGVLRWRRESLERPRIGVGHLVGAFGVLLGAAFGALAWRRGFGGLATPPQEHDTIIHTVLVAYIERSGRSAPWQLMPVDVLAETPNWFYPAGMHLLSAVTGSVLGGPIEGFNAITLVLLAVAAAFSIGSLAFVGARRAGLGSAGGMLAAGVAALVSAGLYRPVIALAVEGGGLPQAAAFVLTPGMVAAMLTIQQREWRGAAAIGIGCGGLVALHPSAVATVGVTLVAWWVGEAFSRGGVQRIRQQIVVLAAAGGVALLVALPTLLSSQSSLSRTTSAPPDIAGQKLGDALGLALNLTFEGYLAEHRGKVQAAALALFVLGTVAILVARRGFGALTTWAVWMAISLATLVAPGRGLPALITGFFYHASLRTRGLPWLFVSVIAGIGVAITAAAVAIWLRRRTPARLKFLRPAWVAAALVALVGLAYAAVPARSYAFVTSEYLASRYAKPQFQRIGADDDEAGRWLAAKIAPGERVLNSANDGSTFMYVRSGTPVVNVGSMGLHGYPYTYQLLQRFNRYPTDAEIRKHLVDLNVRWVYVDSEAPGILAAGAPEGWAVQAAGGPLYSFAPGLADLDGLPGLTPAFRSGTVTIFQLDLDQVRSF